MTTERQPVKVSQEDYLAQFKQITDEMYETTKRKNSDYTGDAGDAFKNFTMVESITQGGISAEQGFFTRMMDKMMRFAGFVKNGTLQVADEKIEDTVLDLAVYCILFVTYRRAKKKAESMDGTSGDGYPFSFDGGSTSNGSTPGRGISEQLP